MPYVYGHNTAGYSPEADVHYVRDFEDAKRGLISDMLFIADTLEDEEGAENLTLTAEDVNLWSESDSRGGFTGTPTEPGHWLAYVLEDPWSAHSLATAYWINEISEDEWEANDPEGYSER